jgi:hypothetical protein
MITTLEEKQLLEAARERLITWRAPTRTKPNNWRATMSQEKKVEDTTKMVASIVEDVAKAEAKAADVAKVTDTVKATKTAPKAQKKPAPKAAPAAQTAAPAANKKEATVAKKSKSVKKATPAKAKSNGAGGKRISEDAVLRVSKGFKNPYPEGSGPFKRFEICAKSAGKTYGALRSMASLKPTTALNFVRAGGGHFEGK